MDCPICQYKGLDIDAEVCPSCKTDLIAFKAMNAIGSAYRKQKTTILILIILLILALLACVIIYFNTAPAETPKEDIEKIAACESTVKTLQAENQNLKDEVAGLKARQAEILSQAEAAKPKTTTHVVQKGETLYLIAKKYYDDGKRYKKIAADNDLSNPNIITPGQELIINY